MELIIKPTSKCNFSCTFCSAANLSIPTLTKVSDELNDIIHKLAPTTIIFTGGEPTLCPPEFYQEVLDKTEDLDLKPIISLTSNLYEVVSNNIEKWIPLLKDNQRIQVATSFNYGISRRINYRDNYTVDAFKKAMHLFKQYYGYTPSFIGVIDDNNDSTVFDHIELARALETSCKLNSANALGRQKIAYPRYKMMKYYLDIIENNLSEYEQNSFERFNGSCPFNTTLLCANTIRAIYIDTNNKVHWATCEPDLELGNDKILDSSNEEKFYNCIKKPKDIKTKDLINPNDCLICPLLKLCNGCKIAREAAKKDPNHCNEMKKLLPRIIKSRWKL